ncbi:PTS sorbitol transporter subunit IIA [Micrococcales bacterium 31B]|nr:PTS sorbitol transporter subunit IIA [Micrococcales bacterium 31B]
MATYFTSAITEVGTDAAPLCDAGIYILFSPPIPDVLGDSSVVHESTQDLLEFGKTLHLEPGHVIALDQLQARVEEVGSEAMANFAALGHLVLHVDPEPEHTLLPGAVRCSLISGDLGCPEPGSTLTFTS